MRWTGWWVAAVAAVVTLVACSDDATTETVAPIESLDAGAVGAPDVAPVKEASTPSDAGASSGPETTDAASEEVKASCVPGPEVHGYCWFYWDPHQYPAPSIVDTPEELAELDEVCKQYTSYSLANPVDLETEHLQYIGGDVDCLYGTVVALAVESCPVPWKSDWHYFLQTRNICCGGHWYDCGGVDCGEDTTAWTWPQYIRLPKDVIVGGDGKQYGAKKSETVMPAYDEWERLGYDDCWELMHDEWSKAP